MDIPAIMKRADGCDSTRHFIGARGDRQLPCAQLLQECQLLQRRYFQGRTEPGLCKPVMFTWIARDIFVAVMKSSNVAPEAFFSERLRYLLREPDYRVLDPTGWIGGCPPGRDRRRVAFMKRQSRRVLVLKKPGIVAHETDGDLECRCGGDALVANALLLQHLSGGGIGYRSTYDFCVSGECHQCEGNCGANE